MGGCISAVGGAGACRKLLFYRTKRGGLVI
jgi:hypothetical protein